MDGTCIVEITCVNAQGQAKLPGITHAHYTPGTFSGGLERRQKNGNENGDNGDHNEQFNEGKSAGGIGPRPGRYQLPA